MISKTELAKLLNINIRTLHNWEKNRKELYNFIINCIENKNEIISLSDEEVELIKAYRQLDNEEKELYKYEIKARALRKKLK